MMKEVRYCFDNLEDLIDRVHALFSNPDADLPLPPEGEVRYRVQLAIHEWLANLIQHARFGNRRPSIELTIRSNGELVECFIDDNSEGFDLNGRLKSNPSIQEAFPERGMGLHFIRACTRELNYVRLKDGRHRLIFTMVKDEDPWLDIPF
ncbi:MAG: ATP-binding protein [Rhodothermus sp.]|nr:ATP-binding protein [Rhodothermus sp.]